MRSGAFYFISSHHSCSYALQPPRAPRGDGGPLSDPDGGRRRSCHPGRNNYIISSSSSSQQPPRRLFCACGVNHPSDHTENKPPPHLGGEKSKILGNGWEILLLRPEAAAGICLLFLFLILRTHAGCEFNFSPKCVFAPARRERAQRAGNLSAQHWDDSEQSSYLEIYEKVWRNLSIYIPQDRTWKIPLATIHQP